jgi:hypothetical protein
LNKKGKIKDHHYDVYRLSIANTAYLRDVFIPFLASLDWHSKKAKDFQDWKAIFELKDKGKDKGLHYTDEGLKLIQLINSQMNSRRLSSYDSVLVDRTALYLDIERLLQGPSNYEEREGVTWIISQNRAKVAGVKQSIQLLDDNGNIVKVFDSQTDCAKYLNTLQGTTSGGLRFNRSFLFEGRLYSLKVVTKTS